MHIKLSSFLHSAWIILKFGIGISFVASVALLAVIVFYDGYHYQIDNDELFNAHMAYLLLEGNVPYIQIYMSVYTPVFQILLVPIYWLFGYSIQTLLFTRYIVILLNILRLIAGFFLVKKLFDTKAGLLFVVLLLLDPISQYASGQVRQDNLMITTYIVGITYFVYGISGKSTQRWRVFISGIFLSLSVLSLLKILPSIAVFLFITILYFGLKRQYMVIFDLVAGMVLPVLIFLGYVLYNGAFYDMFRQVILESVQSYSNVFEYPVHLGFYFKPDNAAVYGVWGKPLSWIYAWVFPMIGFGGAFHVLMHIVHQKTVRKLDIIKGILIITLFAQWLFLFYVESVFIQHYLPITWLYALFAGGFVSILLNELKKNCMIYTSVLVVLLIGYTVCVRHSIFAHYERSKMRSYGLQEYYDQYWNEIPEGEPVFPHFLFRPLAYPVPYGHFIGNIPESILNSIGSIPQSLKKSNVRYIVMSEYYRNHLPPEAQEYILVHYTKQPILPDFYIRNE